MTTPTSTCANCEWVKPINDLPTLVCTHPLNLQQKPHPEDKDKMVTFPPRTDPTDTCSSFTIKPH